MSHFRDKVLEVLDIVERVKSVAGDSAYVSVSFRYFSSESMDARLWVQLETKTRAHFHDVRRAAEVKEMKKEKNHSSDTALIWRGRTWYGDVDICVPGVCRITSYKEEVVPGTPEKVIPAEPETVKRIPIFDCGAWDEADEAIVGE